MERETARRVMLVRAIEDNDLRGQLVERDRLRQASLEVGMPIGVGSGARLTRGEEEFLGRRADLLWREVRPLGLVGEGGGPRAGRLSLAMLLVPWLALVVGFGSMKLGDPRTFNLLAVPLLVILVLNLVGISLTCLRSVMARWLGWRRSSGLLRGLARRVEIERQLRVGGEGDGNGEDPQRAEVRAQVLRDYRRHMVELLQPLLRARVSLMLHLGAIAFAAGGVAGMYQSGWARDYGVYWESTLMDEGQVRAFYGTLFWPAQRVFGLDLPLDELAQMRHRPLAGQASGADEPGLGEAVRPALPWMHLYAATLGLFVLVPRLLLAGVEGLRARRERHRPTLPVGMRGYMARLLQTFEGGDERVMVVPYAHVPDGRARDALRGLLHELWGGSVAIEFLGPVAYGSEEEVLAEIRGKAGGGGWGALTWVMYFNLASTPEDENHGALAKGLAGWLGGQSGGRLLALADGGSFAEKFGRQPGFDGKLAAREALWRDTMGRAAAGLGLVVVQLAERRARDELLDDMRQATWVAGVGR
jgi:hypothetical protein